MKKLLSLLVILSLSVALPAAAARITSSVTTHTGTVFQAYSGCSEGSLLNRGNERPGDSVITAAPGILAIDPGNLLWKNYVAAACREVEYGLKNVTFTKDTPAHIQCGYDEQGNPIFPPHTINQQGTSHIRLWWPLMYELPGTTFTLCILYGTPTLFDSDGSGPNTAAWVHMERWVWTVDLDVEHFEYLIKLFHELPFGKSEVPLINDEELYGWLIREVGELKLAAEKGKNADAAAILSEMEMKVMESQLGMTPPCPNPTGAYTGIANTNENPAACKILIDIEYLLQHYFGHTAK